MDYSTQYKALNAQFVLGKNTFLSNSNIEIRFCPFTSISENLNGNDFIVDKYIRENYSFSYPIFIPPKCKKTDKAILLLHGLNERNWNKYLTWAETLCIQTGKVVILFPIAFHINRSPIAWSNPRDLHSSLILRREQNGNDRSLSFANVALSERISKQPYRFYSSGRQSVNDLTELFAEIKLGKHEMFYKNTKLDVFAYSIGAFLSEVTIMSNNQDLFSDSKLFLFCGGGIFSSMQGESRSIMDKNAFENLYNYYLNDFNKTVTFKNEDTILKSFNSMISPDREKKSRESFFVSLGDNMSGISLLNDKVMPFMGVNEAMGNEIANNKIELWDFPYAYTHENPFPIIENDLERVSCSFQEVFSKASQFLA